MASGSEGATESAVFVRKSSGLVRELGLRDTFIMNFSWSGATFSLALAFMMSQALWAYPGGDFGLAQILTMVIFAPGIALTYGLLSGAMPRAGGDYVFTSRTLHPLLGFLGSWGVMMMLAFAVGWGAFWGGAQSISLLLATLGHQLDVSSLVDASEWVAGQTGSFVVGVAVILIFAAVVVRGIRFFARVALWMFGIGIVGMIVGLLVMVFVSQETFVNNFNVFMTRFTDDPAFYQTVIDRAASGGLEFGGFSFGATILIIPIAAFGSLFAFGSAYAGGEVRQARRVQLIAMPLAILVAGVLNVVVYYLTRSLTGHEFLTSISTLWMNVELDELLIFPFFNLFATVAADNAILAVVIGIGYLMLSILFLPMNIMLATRMIFAWSFDRLLPEKLAEVDDRFHSPLYAVGAVVVLSITYLFLLVYTTWLATLGSIAGILPAIILASIVGLVLPRRRPEIFSGIADLRLGRLPLLTVASALALVTSTVILAALLANDLYLVNSSTGLAWIGVVFGLGLVVFVAAWFIRKAQGIDLAKAYEEVPPA